MILDASLSLQVALTAAKSTNDMDIHVDYIDWNNQGQKTSPATYRVKTNGTTDVTILAAPNPGYRREPLRISIYNADTADKTMVLKTDNGTTEYTIWRITLTTLKSSLWEKKTQWQLNI